ncbi:MAG: MFS transporter [Planctomycetaceae bacterium]
MTSRNQSWYALAVLFAINAMNFYDRQIPGAIGESIKNDWKLTDKELGALGTAFVVLYAIVGVPLGRLADRLNRARLLAGGVFAWSLLTAASGWAMNFRQMVALRLAVGVGEATCAPASASLIGDLYPAGTRARAMSIFMLGLPIGLALSFLISGAVAAKWGWHAAFKVALIPGLVCTLGALFLHEPQRGGAEAHAIGALRRDGSPWKLVLSIPTMRWIILSGALLNFNMYALGSFLVSYLMRVHGCNLYEANYVSMWVYGLSGVPGLVIGGWLGDRVARGRVNGRLLLGTAGVTLAVPLIFFALALRDSGLVPFSIAMGLGCLVMYTYYSSVYASIQDVIEPALRGTAMSLYFFAMYLLGGALGPFGSGALSDYFTKRAASAAGLSLSGLSRAEVQDAIKPYGAEGIHAAMHVVPIFCAVLAVVLWAASRSVTRDAENLKRWMSEATREGSGR